MLIHPIKWLARRVKGLRQFLANKNPLKMMETPFSFHLKRSFRSQDI